MEVKRPHKTCEEQLLKIDNIKILEIKNEIQDKIDKAFVFAENSSFPDPSEVSTQLFK